VHTTVGCKAVFVDAEMRRSWMFTPSYQACDRNSSDQCSFEITHLMLDTHRSCACPSRAGACEQSTTSSFALKVRSYLLPDFQDPSESVR
jgi:hypothetical protein